MRIFVAGATGVLGRRIVPMLLDKGHDVAGMTRSRNKLTDISVLGAEPVLCDVYDLDSLKRAVSDFRPDLIMNQLTDLPDRADDLPQYADANNMIRIEGTDSIIQAARNSGYPRLLAQSVAWQLPGKGSEAVMYLKKAVEEYGGTVLRYGQLYGPGTFYERSLPQGPRIHADRAAEITVECLSIKGGVIDVVENQ